MIKYDKIEIERICKESISMAVAASRLGMHFNTFKKIAIDCNCYVPNPGLKGGKRGPRDDGYLTDDILKGRYPHYGTYKLRNRLIDEQYLKYECAICKISIWQGKKLSLQLDHIDGNRCNHLLCNLRLLCPNCHSLTSTYRGKNKTI